MPAAPDSATWLRDAEGDRNLMRGVPPQAAGHSIAGTTELSGDSLKRAGDSRKNQIDAMRRKDAEAKSNQQRPPLKSPSKKENTQASGSLEIESRHNQCGNGQSQYGRNGSGE